MFSDSVGDDQASANLNSLIGTAKANGIEPYRYLRRIFQALPTAMTVDDYEALLPWNLRREVRVALHDVSRITYRASTH